MSTIIFVFLSWLSLEGKVTAAETVTICGGNAPLLLYETESPDQSHKVAAGIYVDNFKRISKLTGINFEFMVLPWRRCLAAVKAYDGGSGPEIAIGGTYSAERAENFHFVGPIYSLQPALFYSQKKFPKRPYSERFGQEISKIEHMQDHRVCGIQGWNYAPYYSQHNFPKNIEIFTTIGRYEQLFPLLARGRCDLFETPPHFVLAELAVGKFKMPPDVACSKMETGKIDWNLLVSKNSPLAQKLVSILSKPIESLTIIEDLTSEIDQRLDGPATTGLLEGCR